MMSSPFTYIVVAGNSGAGKSTLVKSLASALASSQALVVEACDERQFHHPLLMNMFKNPVRWALPIQLNFMTQRACRILDALQSAKPGSVLLMERCLWEDRLFFKYYVGLGKIDAALQEHYDQLLSALIAAIPVPRIMIHLRARTETLYRRLELAYKNRDRRVELQDSALHDYLEGMNVLYDEWRSEIRDVPDEYFEFDIDDPSFAPARIVRQVSSSILSERVMA